MNKKRKKQSNMDGMWPKRPKTDEEKCGFCFQYLRNIQFYKGHPNKSSEEFVALTDEKLSLFTGKEENVHEQDHLPVLKLTDYCVYDERGHMCPLDGGLIEKSTLLHLSGYIKPIYDEDPSIENGIPAHRIGPINEWFISGFDGGERALIGVYSPYAEYYLLKPAEEYCEFVKILQEKMDLLKLIIEFLIENAWEGPTYEDLLCHLRTVLGECEFNEDFLLLHAYFFCEQIYSYDQAAEEDELSILTIPCVRTLAHLAGVTFQQRKQMRQQQSPKKTPKKKSYKKIITTPLVSEIFESFFPDQIEIINPKAKRCGICIACQSPDCGKCINCKNMTKFGGSGKAKQACKMRRCPNMALQDMELSDSEDGLEENDCRENGSKIKKFCSNFKINEVEWSSNVILENEDKKFYSSAIVGMTEIFIGDFVLLNSANSLAPYCIGKIQYMFETPNQGPTTHLHLFWMGSNTILNKVANHQELFVVNICEDCPLDSIVKKAKVIQKTIPNNWGSLGGNSSSDDNQKQFDYYFSKHYDPETATFSDYLPIVKSGKDSREHCEVCSVKNEKKKFETPRLNTYGEVEWKGDLYKIGEYIFLDPSVYKFSSIKGNSNDEIREVDENIYTEYFRKTADVKGSNYDTPEPFIIGQIEKILTESIELQIRIFYRPENTKMGIFLAYHKDINVVFWTDECVSVPFDKVTGKCYLRYFDSLDENLHTWCKGGPYRFYFTEAYNPQTHQFYDVPNFYRKITKSKNGNKTEGDAPIWPNIESPLNCMDVFAGCGGLSLGLHQAGVAETKWAIEKEGPAAQAFKLNNKNCKVFTADCNELLEDILSGTGVAKGLPERGQVQMLVGGPPCQGFSGMNRFNAGVYSLFKSSLVVLFLSICDFYRPKYFILENVRNFVTFKRSIVLKLTLKCLIAIGYQVTFGVVQAGHYGVPQTRRRLILIAAAPGYVLPKLPEPLHVFNRKGCHLSLVLDGMRYTNGNKWTDSAPFRTICVRDAISDLPEIPNGWSETEIAYDSEPISHFQRKMRNQSDFKFVVDHICKKLATIVEARVTHIPIIPGSDWRDLPNICVKLSDGTTTNKLNYYYLKDQKGRMKKGVCQCVLGKSCVPSERQINTLIPWCLPHTADRHNHWAGLYGRLEWDGFFGTTITNPEPMGKQGRVLHPEENRVVSVRECARSQGFPDNYIFCGNLMDKHRQVGNAVPPPLGLAIGLEIKQALALSLCQL